MKATFDTPEHYLDKIDKMFCAAKIAGKSRFDEEWGAWSASMNREIRRAISSLEPKYPETAARYKMVFIYWIVTSRRLETWRKWKGILGRKQLNRGREMLEKIRKQIDNPGKAYEDLDISSPEGIADALFGKMVGRKKDS